MNNITEEDRGLILFNGIESLRTTRFSHYLIDHDFILEINAMQAIYFNLKSIEEILDKDSWGALYPIYRFYLWCRFIYRKTRRAIRYELMKRTYNSSKNKVT